MNNKIKWIVTGVCIFWMSMFFVGVFIGINEHLEKENVRYENIVEK